MVKVKQKFIEGYLSNKLLDAVGSLNEVKDALYVSETEMIERLDSIIKNILAVEV